VRFIVISFGSVKQFYGAPFMMRKADHAGGAKTLRQNEPNKGMKAKGRGRGFPNGCPYRFKTSPSKYFRSWVDAKRRPIQNLCHEGTEGGQ
jgi:hypothetical protein